MPELGCSDPEDEDTVSAMYKRKRKAVRERKRVENAEMSRNKRVIENEDGWEVLQARDPMFEFEEMEAREMTAVAICKLLQSGNASDEHGQLDTDEPAREELPQEASRQPEGETQQHTVGDGVCCSVGGSISAKELALLTKIGGVDLNSVGKDEWISLPYDLVIDSGAAETVIPLSWLGSHPIEESPDSRAGAYYTAANGERIDNEGQRIFTLATSEGVVRKMTFQVCKSSKALGSVSKICKAGHRVVFDDDGSYIEDKKNGEIMWLVERDGLFVLPATYAPPNWKPGDDGGPSKADFGRQGR